MNICTRLVHQVSVQLTIFAKEAQKLSYVILIHFGNDFGWDFFYLLP